MHYRLRSKRKRKPIVDSPDESAVEEESREASIASEGGVLQLVLAVGLRFAHAVGRPKSRSSVQNKFRLRMQTVDTSSKVNRTQVLRYVNDANASFRRFHDENPPSDVLRELAALESEFTAVKKPGPSLERWQNTQSLRLHFRTAQSVDLKPLFNDPKDKKQLMAETFDYATGLKKPAMFEGVNVAHLAEGVIAGKKAAARTPAYAKERRRLSSAAAPSPPSRSARAAMRTARRCWRWRRSPTKVAFVTPPFDRASTHVQLWTLPKKLGDHPPRCQFLLEVPAACVLELAWCPLLIERKAAAGREQRSGGQSGAKRRTIVWDGRPRSRAAIHTTHADVPLSSLVWSHFHEGDQLAAVSDAGYVYVWDLSSEAVDFDPQARADTADHLAGISAVRYPVQTIRDDEWDSPPGSVFVVNTRNRSINLYKMPGMTPLLRDATARTAGCVLRASPPNFRGFFSVDTVVAHYEGCNYAGANYLLVNEDEDVFLVTPVLSTWLEIRAGDAALMDTHHIRKHRYQIPEVVLDRRTESLTRVAASSLTPGLTAAGGEAGLVFVIARECSADVRKKLDEIVKKDVLETSEVERIAALLPPTAAFHEFADRLRVAPRPAASEAETRDYNKMISSVDAGQNYGQTNLMQDFGKEMKEANRQVIAVFNTLITVAGAFAFGFFGVTYMAPAMAVAVETRVIVGMVVATIVFFADLWFIARSMDTPPPAPSFKKEKIQMPVPQAFGSIRRMEASDDRPDVPLDGALGLAWGPFGEDPQLKYMSPIVNILGYLSFAQQFYTIWIDHHVPPSQGRVNGLITIGNFDDAHCDDRQLKFVPLTIDETADFMRFVVQDFTIGPFTKEVNAEAYVDTGSPVIRLPSDLYASVLKQLKPTYDLDRKLLLTSCEDASSLPSFSFLIGDVEHEVASGDYVVDLDLGDDQCALAVGKSEDGQIPFVLGLPFHRSFCTVFQLIGQQVGFAKVLK
ncbi:Peptidase A1 domain-containing protein [Aphelenchoides fujianensis]|nr:Peptidase A1 domain-containing protein [Aphelenchoides fujianensis]